MENLTRRSGARPEGRRTTSPLGSSRRVSRHAKLKHSFNASYEFPTLTNLFTTRPRHSAQTNSIGNFGGTEHRRRKFLGLSRHPPRSEGQHRFLARYASSPKPSCSRGDPRALQMVVGVFYVRHRIQFPPGMLMASPARYVVLVSWEASDGSRANDQHVRRWETIRRRTMYGKAWTIGDMNSGQEGKPPSTSHQIIPKLLLYPMAWTQYPSPQ